MEFPLIRQINEIELREKPFHTLRESELAVLNVSAFSKYAEEIWRFESLVPGHSTFVLNWGMELSDGTLLSDSQNCFHLSWCKKLIGSTLFEPANGHSPAAGTLAEFGGGIKWLISWMIENVFQSPHELTPAVMDKFLEDIVPMLLDRPGIGDTEAESQSEQAFEIGTSTVEKAIRIPILLWDQRRVLEKMGIRPIPRHPYRDQGAWSVAQVVGNKLSGWIKPLPDEVAIRVLNKAAWFIDGPAADVLRLRNEIMSTKEISYEIDGKLVGNSYKQKTRQLKLSLANFVFSTLPGTTEPWHPTIDSQFLDGHDQFGLGTRIRQLLAAVQNACAIIIQSCTGVRISEICGIRAGINPNTGLPTCVRIEPSISQLNEIFILEAPLSKTESTPRNVEWLLGMRPVSNLDLPLPVRAIQILNYLYEPWRKASKTDRLILRFGAGQGTRTKGSVLKPIHNSSLNYGMQDFITDWVDLSDLPDQSAHSTEENDLVDWRIRKGRAFRSHMLRKTWANYVIAVNPKLLQSIQMQFHHVSIAMSDSGYLGNNPIARDALNSIGRQQTNLMIFESILGRTVLAGRMGERISNHLDELKGELKELPLSQAWLEVERFTKELDLHVFPYGPGTCLPMSPAEMACHNAAGTPLLLRKQPDLYYREPSVCAGCGCFLVDISRKKYWEDRYVEYSKSFRQIEKISPMDGSMHVIKARALQAGKILKMLGESTINLDKRVSLALDVSNAKK